MIITNELQPLSKDLTTITTEIKSYENMAGQAIFEIGRRLSWVKKHDLAHGEFGKWLKSINLTKDAADRFMKIDNELSNDGTYRHLGISALYLIATMPKKEREQPQRLSNGETKKPDEMTVRELRDLKKQLKAKEEALSNSQQENESLQAENDSMRKQQVQLNQQLATKQQPKEVVKTVTKEVKPNDYDDIKRHITELEKDKKELAKKVDDQQAEINSYKDLQSQDRQAQHWQNRGKISIYKLTSNTRDYMRANTLTTDDKKAIADASEEALTDLNDCLDDLQKMIDGVRELTNGRRIVEGEIIND
ncbi:MAG TPA: DUF3102 domain-containing protein [Candidatus Limosilactobacillus excrementigallinarum]|nr:DUF3102 domain-containing protein [Candidatus Limosilactobacillus excrementigallinarum]